MDWVELIPFSETRNYVQRIMENLQVYRARFGGGSKLQIEADLQRGADQRRLKGRVTPGAGGTVHEEEHLGDPPCRLRTSFAQQD